METSNLASENVAKIEAIFPNCVTESRGKDGRAKKTVNFEMLRQMLSEEAVEGEEAYEFTWVGKKAAVAEANKPTRMTLRPCLERSVQWNDTENVYIEGDNLEVLKLLQESCQEAVKVIYIDPPYNTGNDFIYKDDFSRTKEEYQSQGLFKNTDSNGRFHSF